MSNFRLSCTTCTTRTPGKDELLECFRYVPQCGFKYWGMAGPPFLRRELGSARWLNVDLIKRLAVEAGFSGCTEVWGLGFPTDSVESAVAAAHDIKLLFDVAQAMGSPVVVITGGKRQNRGMEATVAGIQELDSLISHIPVKLAIEPHYHSQIRDGKDYDDIFSQVQSKRIGITIDTGNFHAIGVDWKALIRRYSDRIFNIHVKDNIGMQGVPLGQGDVDLKGLVEELHAIDYEGALSIELEVEDYENVPRYCSEALAYLKKLIAEVTDQETAKSV